MVGNFTVERDSLKKFRELLKKKDTISASELQFFSEKFEELVDIAEISIKMIDHLVRRQQNERKKSGGPFNTKIASIN